MTTKQEFERRISIIRSFDSGLYHTLEVEEFAYADGFITAANLWHTADTYRQGFRRVVEAKENGILEDAPTAGADGFNDALRLFQEAKSLDT